MNQKILITEEKVPFLNSVIDLLLIFFTSAAICYVSTYLFPMKISIQMMASFVFALVMASHKPDLNDILEWVIFFAFGILTAKMFPLMVEYGQTGNVSVGHLIDVMVDALPYTLKLIAPWILAIPLGLSLEEPNRSSYFKHRGFF